MFLVTKEDLKHREGEKGRELYWHPKTLYYATKRRVLVVFFCSDNGADDQAASFSAKTARSGVLFRGRVDFGADSHQGNFHDIWV